MKVLCYGIFKDHALGADLLLEKGLLANGCEVVRFDFKQQLKSLGKKQADALLLESALQCDLIFIGKGERLDAAVLKRIAAKIPVALCYGDYRPEIADCLQQLLPHTDFLFSTSAGSMLQRYHQLGVKQVSSYVINAFDPDLLPAKPVTDKNLDVLFTGTGYRFAGDERKQVLDYLKQRGDTTFFGGADKFTGNKLNLWQKLKKELSRLDANRKVRGEAYFDVIRRAKIGIGVNAIHTINRYTSDRLIHYAGFGTFFLTQSFPGLYDLFAPDEIVCFQDIAQLDTLLAYYLQHEQEREDIARRAQQRVIAHYNCTNVAAYMLDIIRSGSSDRFAWVETVR